MTRKYVYWRRADTKEAVLQSGGYISGLCAEKDVPVYGVVDTHPIPSQVTVADTDDGRREILSPPVFGTRYAYRLRLSYNISEFSTKSGEDLMCFVRADRVEAPKHDADRDNWWWAMHDRFKMSHDKAPQRLVNKWKGPMIAAALEGHPDCDEMLSKWQETLEAKKANRAYLNSLKPKRVSHKKRDGDLVVMPHPICFTNSGDRQVFEFRVEKDSFGRRNTHKLLINSTRFKVSHGSAAPFYDGRPPHEEIRPPVALALAILAECRAPLESNHAILAAEAKFKAPYEEALARMEGYGAPTKPAGEYDVAIWRARADMIAADAALRDFGLTGIDDENSPKKQAAHRKILAKIKDARDCFAAWHEANPDPESDEIEEDG